jgi:hypothetical protein
VLQRAGTDIKKPIEKIDVYRADHAHVKGGNRQKQGDPLTTFEVCKQDAWWMIILGTVSTSTLLSWSIRISTKDLTN